MLGGMPIQGRCHCGNLAFALTSEALAHEIPARACSCSFCTRHGALWTSDPAGALVITVADPARLERYAFGTHTADFLLCSRCGVPAVVTCELDGRLLAVVNVNTFVDVDPARLRRAPASFDGEDLAARLARRARGWIGRVELVVG
jgi:hypothetical protein